MTVVVPAVGPPLAVARTVDGVSVQFPLDAKPNEISPFLRDFLHVPDCGV